MITKTFEELKLSQKLPSPSGVGMRILELTRKEDFSATEMGDTIKTDSSLTGRILKLANSASNAGVEPATTVTHSIMRLGSRTVRDLALAFSLVSGHRDGKCDGFDYDRYWSHSLARAVAAQTLARLQPACKPEEGYICGLLADIGLLALASVHPEAYTQIMSCVERTDHATLRKMESERFDIHHGQVAIYMMEEWGLPSLFGESVLSFVQSRDIAQGRADDESTGIDQLLRYADTLANLMTVDESSRLNELAKLKTQIDALQERLGMEPDAFATFVDSVLKEWVTWGETLKVDTDSELSHRTVLVRLVDAEKRLAAGETDPPLPGYKETPSESGAETGVAPAEQPAAAGSSAAGLTGPTGPQAQTVWLAAEEEVEEEKPIRILAIDDDPVTLKILVKHLENGGYEVMQARNGKEGLQMALENDPEVIMSDWDMPGLDGLELCTELRRTESGKNIYFLLLTGRAEEERIVEAFESGVDDYITKPFIPRILAARIKGGARLVNLQRQVEEDRRIMRQQVAELGQMTRKLRSVALTDALTDLPNRRYAMKRMDNEWSFMKRTGRPLTLIMMDIDRFKAVNDTHGHDIGDVVLQQTARTLEANVRDVDEVCRFGGEEFLVICKNTMQEDGMIVAERIRAGVEANLIKNGTFDRNVTMSLGVAGQYDAIGTVSELLKRADEAVYDAKHGGRNRVCGGKQLDQRKSA
ncbi:MAG: two-component system cell cycle response regulator [Planctomycetota bacterium]|jgi:two-component system cell cycle response regulator